jgi:hypothetical protein
MNDETWETQPWHDELACVGHRRKIEKPYAEC